MTKPEVIVTTEPVAEPDMGAGESRSPVPKERKVADAMGRTR
jgi:hypothetical protein